MCQVEKKLQFVYVILSINQYHELHLYTAWIVYVIVQYEVMKVSSEPIFQY
jgi:hypothetical protein